MPPKKYNSTRWTRSERISQISDRHRLALAESERRASASREAERENRIFVTPVPTSIAPVLKTIKPLGTGARLALTRRQSRNQASFRRNNLRSSSVSTVPQRIQRDTAVQARQEEQCHQLEQKSVESGKVSISIDGIFLFACPHCGGAVEVSRADLNCRVFRHGTNVISGHPINPHTSEAECEQLRASGQVRGCARPFLFDGVEAIACGYDT
jgi:hypothetical protein